MAFSERTRFGSGTILIDAYGGNFSSPTDLGSPNGDGIIISDPDVVEFEIEAGDTPGLEDYIAFIKKFTIECQLLKHKLEHIAFSVGQPTSDVTDNSGATPKNKEIDIGGLYPNDVFALRIKNPQLDDPTLFDILTFYRVRIRPSYNQIFKQEPRYTPVQFVCLRDPSNSNKLLNFMSEYTAA